MRFFSRTWVRNCPDTKAALGAESQEPALPVLDSSAPGLSRKQVNILVSDASPHIGCQRVSKEVGSPYDFHIGRKPSASHQSTHWEMPSNHDGGELWVGKTLYIWLPSYFTHTLSHITFPIKNVSLKVTGYIFYKQNCPYLSFKEGNVSSVQNHWIVSISPLKSLWPISIFLCHSNAIKVHIS